MTDNEIIKGINYCANVECRKNCDNCPIKAVCDSEDYGAIKLVNDLINRQKAEISVLRKLLDKAEAEIERLQELLEGWKTEAYKVADEKDKLYCEAVEMVKTTKAEVIKEFADKLEIELVHLEEYFIEAQDWSARNTVLQVISKIKEMVGDTE